MADDQATTTDQDASQDEGRKGPGLLVWAVLGLAAAAGGFAAPFFLPATDDTSSADEPSGPPVTFPDEVGFVPFGEVTVNLDEGRLTRYLRLSFSLQVDKADEAEVTKLVESRKAVLKNWLLSNLSDKAMDDIRGAAGQNRLRREILDQFNTVLFPDGYDRIYDVLFEEFNVQ